MDAPEGDSPDSFMTEEEWNCRIQFGPRLDHDLSILAGEYITKKITDYADNIAQIDANSGAKVTFKEVIDKSDALCAALERRMRPGATVAIIGKNCIEYVWILLGAMKAKITNVLVNPNSTPQEINHNFSISKPDLVLCSAAVAWYEHNTGVAMAQVFLAHKGVQEVWVWDEHRTDKINDVVRVLEEMIALDYDAGQIIEGNKDTESVWNAYSTREAKLEEFINEDCFHKKKEGNIVINQMIDVATEDHSDCALNLTALILSSSGSTGLPKGVMLSHQNVTTALHTGNNYIQTDEISLGLMPFYHAYGLILMLMCLCEGSCLIVMDKFAVDNFIRAIQKYKINNLFLVPSLMAILYKQDVTKQADLSSVRHIWTGAAPINKKLQEMVRLQFQNQAILHHSYGLTETTFTMFTGKYRIDKPESPGTLTPGIDCMVSDSKGFPVLANVKGELCFRGPLLMQGYKNNTLATSLMIKSIDEDNTNKRWLHSGDLGYYDEDGYFYIVDRLKELIKYQGHQVSPSELEAILVTHSAVQDVAVLGIPHEVFGELPQALIVKQPEVQVSEEDIHHFLAGEVSPHKQLHGGVRFVESIPKTPSGKILRRVLKELYLKA